MALYPRPAWVWVMRDIRMNAHARDPEGGLPPSR